MSVKILKSGSRIELLTEEEQNALRREYNRKPINYVRVQPDGLVIWDPYIEFADRYINFKFNKDDVLLMGFPKSGTTWAQEILWTMIHNPNLNAKDATKSIYTRSRTLELDAQLKIPSMQPLEPGNEYYDTFVASFPDKNPNDGIILQTIEQMERPRIIKTHLLFSLLPDDLLEKCKVVYIARNPKDVVVSFWHFQAKSKMHSFTGSLHQFMEYFINDLVTFSPYWKNVKEAWRKQSHPNLHFMFYEDLKENPKLEFTHLQKFLGLTLAEKQIDKIIQYTSFDVMKTRELSSASFAICGGFHQESNDKSGGFYRKGIVGDSKKNLTEEEITKMDEWILKNTQDLSVDFKYKI